jgi:hypothetical protein
MSTNATQTNLEGSADERHLERRITDALSVHHVPSLRRVSVEVREGSVVLRGTVSSFYAKQLLQHSARRLSGNGYVIDSDEVAVATPAAFADRPRLCQSAAAGVALLVMMLVTGCSKEPDLLPVHPVTGQVLLDGRPAAGAFVYFHPKTGSGTFPTPTAKADARGNFSLTTYRAEDGAPLGEYAVTVELRQVVQKQGEVELGPNVLPPKYSSPKTTSLVANVIEGANSVPIKISR